MTLLPGTQVGAYTIVGALGSGGMGDVYKAFDVRLNRTVAIKLLKNDLPGDVEYAARFEREARTIAGLSHPHVCVLHDIGMHGDARYLVMEFIEGETLAERLRRGALPEGVALTYAAQIAGALGAAHAKGIIHRDLKPGNVMLTGSGAKLLDFGLATPAATDVIGNDAVATMPALTQQWQVIGTLPYMSPERLGGRASDARGDVFAFGAVLYEMLAGRRAFTGDSPAQIIASVISGGPPPIPGVSAAIDRVLRRCMAPDPADRWPRMGEVTEALASAASNTAGAGTRGPARHRLRVIAIAVAGLVFAAAGFFAVPSLWRERHPVVILMDSTLPERVYDPVTRKDGGTNSDDISDTLSDLPLELHKETTSAPWHREDQIIQQHPALVMMHLSSFAAPVAGPDDKLQPQAEERTRSFLGFVGVANPRTRFVVYTRGFATEAEREAWIGQTVQRFPALHGRVRMLHIPGEEHATFRSPATRALVTKEVSSVLGLILPAPAPPKTAPAERR